MRPPLAGPPTSGKSIGGGTASWDGRVAGAAQRLEAMVPGARGRIIPARDAAREIVEMLWNEVGIAQQNQRLGRQVHLCFDYFGNWISGDMY